MKIYLKFSKAEIVKNSYLINLGYANIVLNKKELPIIEVKEFKEFSYQFAVDIANIASESFLGFGKKVSKKEETVLAFIEKFLEL